MDMPAVALTETNNLFSALEFSIAASGAGIQPILGCQVDVGYLAAVPGERPKPPAAPPAAAPATMARAARRATAAAAAAA